MLVMNAAYALLRNILIKRSKKHEKQEHGRIGLFVCATVFSDRCDNRIAKESEIPDGAQKAQKEISREKDFGLIARLFVRVVRLRFCIAGGNNNGTNDNDQGWMLGYVRFLRRFIYQTDGG